jgi:hypothetical protein
MGALLDLPGDQRGADHGADDRERGGQAVLGEQDREAVVGREGSLQAARIPIFEGAAGCGRLDVEDAAVSVGRRASGGC